MSKIEKIILSALTLTAAVLAVLLLVRTNDAPEDLPNPQPTVGQFVPPPFDPTAVVGTPVIQSPDSYGTLELGDAATVSLYSTPVVRDGKAAVYFAAHESSAAWVRLRLMDEQGSILGQTDLVKPGEYVQYITLARAVSSPHAVAKILTYEPETYYSLGSATVNLQLQIQ